MFNSKLSEQDLSNVLHYGVQVSISLADENLAKGYIFGDGFITKTISYKKDSAFAVEDFTGAIFKVMQPYKNSAHKQLEEGMLIQLEEGRLLHLIGCRQWSIKM